MKRLEVFEAIQRRHSVRRYLKRDVPHETILKILEVARLSPSAANIQPWYFIIVRDDKKRYQISKSGLFARFIQDAPVLIVGCSYQSASKKWHTIDVAIALEHMVLEATELGLGTCWIGSFNQNVVKDILKIPERLSIVAMVTVGYPEEGRDLGRTIIHMIHRKKKLEDIVGFDEYGRTLSN